MFNFDRTFNHLKSQLNDLYLPIRHNSDLIKIASLHYSQIKGQEFIDKSFLERYENLILAVKRNSYLATPELRPILEDFFMDLSTTDASYPPRTYFELIKENLLSQVIEDSELIIGKLNKMVRYLDK